MKKKRQIALNKLFNTCIIIGAFLGFAAFCFAEESNIPWAIGFGIFALGFIVLPCFFTPFCYSFDSDGVSLLYVFSPTERYLWKNIHSIEVIEKSTEPSVIDLLYSAVFAISGRPVGKSRFYMEGHIRKTFRTKRLLEKYWDGTITGYFFEDIKKWFAKHKKKTETQTKIHLTDEIIPMERTARAKARAIIEPFAALAKQQNLVLKTKYLYITEEFDELRSRPEENYTYTALVEISHPYERNESRIVEVSADLLFVRLGKTAYRGVVNESFEEDITFFLEDTLKEIEKNGIEVYCRNN